MGGFNPPTQIVNQKCSVQALNVENPTFTDLQDIRLTLSLLFVFVFNKIRSPICSDSYVFNIKYKNGCVGSSVVSACPVHVRLEVFSPQHRMASINANIQLVCKTPKSKNHRSD